jgi:hypothetical protein
MIHVLKRNQEAHIILVENKKNQKRKINEETSRKFSSKKNSDTLKLILQTKLKLRKYLISF